MATQEQLQQSGLRIEAPQTCLGVCAERRLFLVVVLFSLMVSVGVALEEERGRAGASLGRGSEVISESGHWNQEL